ncbi:type VI secretion system Vgr family protein [Rugamonas sp. CCM 8940]|nr:type VI secretion system tip protein VgrG [Rugamonas sp. CCM 8940]
MRMTVGFASGASDGVLLPHRLSGVEAICDGIDMRIYCVSTDELLPLKTLIGLPVALQIVTDQGNLRSICGLVAEASQGESDGGLATYQLVVRDALAILDLDVHTRVFRNSSELAVVKTLLDEARLRMPALAAAFEFEVDTALELRQDPARSQIIQCNESTGAFIRRLLKRRGIGWFFRAGRAGADRADAEAADARLGTPVHTMVLFHDAMRLKPSSAGRVRFHRNSATEERDTITAWSGVRTLRPGRVSRFSWNYSNPRAAGFMLAGMRSAADQGVKGEQLAAGLEQYLVDAPHVGDNYDDLCALARQRMARSDFEAKCFYAEGGLRDVGPGEYIGLDGHAELDSHAEDERNFIIVAQHVTAQNNLPKGLDARVERMFARNHWAIDTADLPLAGSNWFDAGELRFLSRLTCIRRGTDFVPAYDPRVDLPHPQLQSAIVAGPSGEVIHTDGLGRVEVTLVGARTPGDDAAEAAAGPRSAWVRVAGAWAGTAEGGGGHFGMLCLPRAGTEVLLAFLGGDPDKPVIVGQLYNGAARPPQLGLGDLPGNKYLSGIKSREVRGNRANQLRLDDTPGQISAQLASEHGVSELNLGWLTAPRNKGAGAARGEGAELRTDEQLALRAGKGMLLSAWQRLDGDDKQLERKDYLALMEDCVELFRTLGKYAAENQALPLDEVAQLDLQSAVKRWENGSNTAPRGEQGGAAAIGVTAPDGISFATSKAIVSYAAVNIDSVARQHMQMTAGQRCNLNAGKGISLFAHHDGIKAIAHHGKLVLQSQHDETQINAALNITLTASDGKLVGMAKEILLITEGGSFIRLAEDITLGTKGNIIHHGAKFPFKGPSSMQTQFPTFRTSDTDLKFAVKHFANSPDELVSPAEHAEVSMANGDTNTGKTDEQGKSDLKESEAMTVARLRVLENKA